MKPEGPPRVGFRLALRALLACLLVTVITAAAVATAALRELDDILDPIRKPGRADIRIPELDTPPPGGPRTFMILGSDKREGADRFSPPRSDTILLARADPDAEAVTVTSIPRDLKVDVPGHGQNKINAAFELGGRKGGPGLVVKTIKKLFKDKLGEDLPITNVMVMDYGAFRRAVNYIDGVYVDVDRHYFNDNSSGENYATIDVDAGYQKLMGKDALDYVRYRHGDNDLVRAARQQDFLRQAKDAAGVRRLLSGGLGAKRHLLQVFSRYFRVDASLRSNKQVLSLLKLAIFLSAKNPGQPGQVPGPRRAEPAAGLEPVHQQVRPEDGLPPVHEPRGHGGAVQGPDQAGEEHAGAQGHEGQAEGRRGAGARGRPPRGRGPGRDRRPEARLPVLLPGGAGEGLDLLRDRAAARVHAQGRDRQEAPGLPARAARSRHRRVLRRPGHDLAGAADPRRPGSHGQRDGRKLRLYYDGSHLRLVAWKSKKAVYWVSNTLTNGVANAQMLEIAASLKRLKQ